MTPQEQLKLEINNDICKLVEKIFRVRDNEGILHDYTLVEPHKKLLRTGLLGDRSILGRIIVKGRQGGYSNFQAIEKLLTAKYYPNTHIYYIATREEQAKDWLRDRVERLAKDARLNFDGSRIIDLDAIKSSQLQKLIKHFPKGRMRKEVEYAYIVGLAASPESVQGPTGLDVTMDEMPLMVKWAEQQRETYDAVSSFVSQGGMLTMQGVPQVRSDLFWKIYTNPSLYGMTAFYFPTIENWQDINLRLPLYQLDYDKIFEGDRKWYEERKNVKINKKIHETVWMQKMNIPYFWWDIGELEKKRIDIDYFKQWMLGIPFDVKFRFIPPELLYPRVTCREQDRPTPGREVRMGIDVGQERDLSAITIVEIDEFGVMREIWIEETQDYYPDQAKNVIVPLCKRYKPSEIVIDNTGVGRGLADILERDYFMSPRRIEFASTVQLEDRTMRMTEFLAMSFKRALIANKYLLIDHSQALHHVLGIQRLETASKQIRYTGKESESKRDDYFWSKCLVNANFDYDTTEPAFYADNEVGTIFNKRENQNSGQNMFEGAFDVAGWN